MKTCNNIMRYIEISLLKYTVGITFKYKFMSLGIEPTKLRSHGEKIQINQHTFKKYICVCVCVQICVRGYMYVCVYICAREGVERVLCITKPFYSDK